MWAEGEVLYFNTILNKSSEWGVSPFHWYFTSALPRALLGALLFIPIALLHKREGKKSFVEYFVCVLAFVVLYSYLPHKELRFIFYALPIFNLVAAIGLCTMYGIMQL